MKTGAQQQSAAQAFAGIAVNKALAFIANGASALRTNDLLRKEEWERLDEALVADLETMEVGDVSEAIDEGDGYYFYQLQDAARRKTSIKAREEGFHSLSNRCHSQR